MVTHATIDVETVVQQPRLHGGSQDSLGMKLHAALAEELCSRLLKQGLDGMKNVIRGTVTSFHIDRTKYESESNWRWLSR